MRLWRVMRSGIELGRFIAQSLELCDGGTGGPVLLAKSANGSTYAVASGATLTWEEVSL